MESSLRNKEYDLLHRASLLLCGSHGRSDSVAQMNNGPAQLEWQDAPIEEWRSDSMKSTYEQIQPVWTANGSSLPHTKSTAEILLKLCDDGDSSSSVMSDDGVSVPTVETWVPLHPSGNVMFGTDVIYKQRILHKQDLHKQDLHNQEAGPSGETQHDEDEAALVRWLSEQDVSWEKLSMQAILQCRPSLERLSEDTEMGDEDIDSQNLIGFHNPTALKQALANTAISRRRRSWSTDLKNATTTLKVTEMYSLGPQVMQCGLWDIPSGQGTEHQTVIMDVTAVQQMSLTGGI